MVSNTDWSYLGLHTLQTHSYSWSTLEDQSTDRYCKTTLSGNVVSEMKKEKHEGEDCLFFFQQILARSRYPSSRSEIQQCVSGHVRWNGGRRCVLASENRRFRSSSGEIGPGRRWQSTDSTNWFRAVDGESLVGLFYSKLKLHASFFLVTGSDSTERS